MIAAALAVGLTFAAAPSPAHRGAYSPVHAAFGQAPRFQAPPRQAAPRLAAPTRSAWDAQVLRWLSAGTRLCLASPTRADLARLAAAYGARPAPTVQPAARTLQGRAVQARGAAFATPAWLLGGRGEVALTADDTRQGLRCALVASTGDAAALAGDLPGLAAALGFARTPTTPARWPGEAAYRGRGGAVRGAYLFTAAPFIHGAPFGALLVAIRPSR